MMGFCPEPKDELSYKFFGSKICYVTDKMIETISISNLQIVCLSKIKFCECLGLDCVRPILKVFLIFLFVMFSDLTVFLVVLVWNYLFVVKIFQNIQSRVKLCNILIFSPFPFPLIIDLKRKQSFLSVIGSNIPSLAGTAP